MSLFATARHVRVASAGEESLEAFTTLLNADRAGNPVVAIAPSVKTSAKIVKLALESPRAMAFACYAPTAADAERLASTMAGEQGLRPAPGVARRLVETTGGDRAVIAREIDKLALYLDASAERPHDLDHAALDAIGADLGEAEWENLQTQVDTLRDQLQDAPDDEAVGAILEAAQPQATTVQASIARPQLSRARTEAGMPAIADP